MFCIPDFFVLVWLAREAFARQVKNMVREAFARSDAVAREVFARQ